MPWATTADVLSFTGVNVVEQDITEAQGIVDLYSGITVLATANLKARDIRLLKQAVCYQAAWAAGQIDVFNRIDVSSANQDGMDFTVTDPDALIISPLAKRCLDRLSWRKSRSVNVRRTDSHGDANDFYTDSGVYSERGWLRF